MRSTTIVHCYREHPGIEPGTYIQSVNMYENIDFPYQTRAPARTCVAHNFIVYNMSLLFLTRPVLRIELRSITTLDH